MRTITKLSMILLMVLSVAACTKEGPAGKDGKDGVDGKDGNANVHSVELTIYTSDWQAANGGGYYATKQVSQITQSVVDNGVVMVYLKDTTHNTYYALPFGNLTYGFGVGSIAIFNPDIPNSDFVVKVVIIDGTPPSSVNLQDYNSVANYYNLDDM